MPSSPRSTLNQHHLHNLFTTIQQHRSAPGAVQDPKKKIYHPQPLAVSSLFGFVSSIPLCLLFLCAFSFPPAVSRPQHGHRPSQRWEISTDVDARIWCPQQPQPRISNDSNGSGGGSGSSDMIKYGAMVIRCSVSSSRGGGGEPRNNKPSRWNAARQQQQNTNPKKEKKRNQQKCLKGGGKN